MKFIFFFFVIYLNLLEYFFRNVILNYEGANANANANLVMMLMYVAVFVRVVFNLED